MKYQLTKKKKKKTKNAGKGHDDETALRVLFCEPFNLFDTQMIVDSILYFVSET